MNMKQLKYVQVLTEEGSFARAAETLGISQPSLSQYIKKIESQVGMELFDRNGGEVRLTDAGKIYIEAGKKILELERQMQNRFSDLAGNKCGTVVVGTSPYRSATMMPQVVRQFQTKYPGMQVIVEEMTSAELEEATERGKFDLCLTLAPIDENRFSGTEITEEELILAVPASFPQPQAEHVPGEEYPVIDVNQINGSRFVMLTELQAMQRILSRLCQDHELSIQPAATVKSLEAQILMVRAGVGMALVPTGIEAFCSTDEVFFYSFRQKLPRRRVVAMWRKDTVLSNPTKDLLDMMKKGFQ